MTTDERSGGDVLAAGTRLEEFEIDRELGAGGFGVTYLAHDRSLGRRVAIKEYLPRDWGARGPDGGVGPRSATDAQDYEWGLDRFLEEARVLARLRHAHVLQVHRVIEARGTAYMVTEYVKGRSLAEALRAEGPWAEARVLALLDALTAGLAAVHGAGLVHRDVKPANVMLRGDGSPVLIDFGSARQAVGGRSRSVTAVLTPGYAPFEQYSTKGVQGPWTDVYALGAVAYEALSGRVPEEAPARLEDDTLRPVSEAATGGEAVSARSSAAVMSALALRREDRPQSLADWRARLGLPAAGVARDRGSRAPEPPPSPKPSLPSVPPVPGPPLSGPVVAPRRWRLAAEPIQYAGFWRRVAALIIDVILFSIVDAVVGVVVGVVVLVGAFDLVGAAGMTEEAFKVILGLVSFVMFLLNWAYFGFFESSSLQATPGKRVLEIVVTDEHGERITFGRATGRFFGQILSATTIIGFAMAGFTEKKQALHDMMAGTLVVRKQGHWSSEGGRRRFKS